MPKTVCKAKQTTFKKLYQTVLPQLIQRVLNIKLNGECVQKILNLLFSAKNLNINVFLEIICNATNYLSKCIKTIEIYL